MKLFNILPLLVSLLYADRVFDGKEMEYKDDGTPTKCKYNKATDSLILPKTGEVESSLGISEKGKGEAQQEGAEVAGVVG